MWKPHRQGESFMLETLPQDHPYTIQQETDTASPRSVVPIYLIHGGSSPFCNSPRCFCQRGKRAAAAMFPQLTKGKLQLAQLIQELPQDCEWYGHSWQVTEQNGVKECVLCHVRGYCPGCMPIAPGNAQPFTCTTHTVRQVQP